MVHCANPIVREYMHGGDNELEELCPPQLDFQIDTNKLLVKTQSCLALLANAI